MDTSITFLSIITILISCICQELSQGGKNCKTRFHLNGIQGVRGSNPLSSTNKFRAKKASYRPGVGLAFNFFKYGVSAKQPTAAAGLGRRGRELLMLSRRQVFPL